MFTRDSLTAPADLWALGADGKATQLTQMNGDVLPSLKLGQPEQFTLKGALDETVHGTSCGPSTLRREEEVPARPPHSRRAPRQMEKMEN